MSFADENAIFAGMDDGGGRPSWHTICASYLRSYSRAHGAVTVSECMPADKRIVLAMRRLYTECTPAERAVMDGTSTLSGSIRSKVFTRLCCKLAVASQLTQAVIMPPDPLEEKR